MRTKLFTRLEVAKAGGPVRLVRKNAPFGSSGSEVEVAFSVVSPGTERAFALGMDNTPGTGSEPRWPYYPGYSASGYSYETHKLVACRTWHASQVKCSWVTDVPKGASVLNAAFTTIGQVAVQAIQNRPEQEVVIVGAGLIGRMVDLVARHCGWKTSLIPVRQRGVVAGGLDGHALVIETSGRPDGWNMATHLVKPGGEMVVLGSYREPVQFDLYAFHKKRARITGAWANGCTDEQKRAGERLFLAMLASGLSMSSLIGEVVPWKSAARAYRRMLAGKMKGCTMVIDWRGA